jgi:prefoldin subunit 5
LSSPRNGSFCLADIGAVKSTGDATKFYDSKVEELGASLKDLETVVQGKSNNLQVVEDGK